MQREWDVIIVGGGSAGLSAALMLVRARRQVLVLDGGAPRNRFAAHMHGVLGRDGWSPLELLEHGRAEVERYGGVVRSGEVAKAERIANRDDAGFAVTLESGERHHARRLVVATGLRDELPEIPGLAEQWGRARSSARTATGGRCATSASACSRPAGGASTRCSCCASGRRRSPSSRTARMSPPTTSPASSPGASRVERRPVAQVVADADGRLRGIRLADDTEVPVDSIFLGPRFVPNDDLLLALGAAASEAFDGGVWVEVDGTGRTSVPGLWAAGNVVNPMASVPLAAGAGNLAGAAINADLIDEEIRTALAG